MSNIKSVPIKTNNLRFFRQYLEVLSPILDLREKEKDVLAAILYQNNKLKEIPEKHRWIIIFDYDTKMEMKDMLNMGTASFNNYLTALRSKGILVDNSIRKNFLVYPDKNFKVVFDFTVVDE